LLLLLGGQRGTNWGDDLQGPCSPRFLVLCGVACSCAGCSTASCCQGSIMLYEVAGHTPRSTSCCRLRLRACKTCAVMGVRSTLCHLVCVSLAVSHLSWADLLAAWQQMSNKSRQLYYTRLMKKLRVAGTLVNFGRTRTQTTSGRYVRHCRRIGECCCSIRQQPCFCGCARSMFAVCLPACHLLSIVILDTSLGLEHPPCRRLLACNCISISSQFRHT
jgi:hypothetical protein